MNYTTIGSSIQKITNDQVLLFYIPIIKYVLESYTKGLKSMIIANIKKHAAALNVIYADEVTKDTDMSFFIKGKDGYIFDDKSSKYFHVKGIVNECDCNSHKINVTKTDVNRINNYLFIRVRCSESRLGHVVKYHKYIYLVYTPDSALVHKYEKPIARPETQPMYDALSEAIVHYLTLIDKRYIQPFVFYQSKWGLIVYGRGNDIFILLHQDNVLNNALVKHIKYSINVQGHFLMILPIDNPTSPEVLVSLVFTQQTILIFYYNSELKIETISTPSEINSIMSKLSHHTYKQLNYNLHVIDIHKKLIMVYLYTDTGDIYVWYLNKNTIDRVYAPIPALTTHIIPHMGHNLYLVAQANKLVCTGNLCEYSCIKAGPVSIESVSYNQIVSNISHFALYTDNHKHYLIIASPVCDNHIKVTINNQETLQVLTEAVFMRLFYDFNITPEHLCQLYNSNNDISLFISGANGGFYILRRHNNDWHMERQDTIRFHERLEVLMPLYLRRPSFTIYGAIAHASNSYFIVSQDGKLLLKVSESEIKQYTHAWALNDDYYELYHVEEALVLMMKPDKVQSYTKQKIPIMYPVIVLYPDHHVHTVSHCISFYYDSAEKVIVYRITSNVIMVYNIENRQSYNIGDVSWQYIARVKTTITVHKSSDQLYMAKRLQDKQYILLNQKEGVVKSLLKKEYMPRLPAMLLWRDIIKTPFYRHEHHTMIENTTMVRTMLPIKNINVRRAYDYYRSVYTDIYNRIAITREKTRHSTHSCSQCTIVVPATLLKNIVFNPHVAIMGKRSI